MTPEQLKASILKYAMEGKLVCQSSADSSVDDLISSIVEKKQELIREGIIKKTKPLSPITDEDIPFDIPNSWRWVRLLDLCETIGDIDHKMPKTADDGNGYPFLSAKDINDDYTLNFTTNIKFISQEDFDRLRIKMQPRKNDIIFSRIGSLGKIGIVEDNTDFLVSYSCCVIRPLLVNLHYLKFFLEGPQIQAHIRRAKTGIGVPDLGMAMIKEIPVPLPPIEEQIRIVDKLNEFLPYIDRYAASYEKLEQFNAKFPEDMKKSILQYAIQGKLVEQRPEEGTAEDLYKSIQEEKQKLIKEGKIKKEKPLAEITEDEIPFDIPDSWKWCRLSQIIDVRDGTHDSPKYVPDGIPLVTSKNLSNGIIDYSNIKYITQEDADKINERSVVNDNDILFAMIGSIGNPVLVKKDREFCIKNMALFKKYDNTNMDMNFMYWFFLYAQYALKAEASGGVQSFISLGRFREYLIPLPPYEEQGRIAKKIEKLLPYCDQLIK